jgi:hypothetical protein
MKADFMGITIHFKGRLNKLQEINSVMDDLIDISETMQWKWTSLDEDWDKPASAKLSVTDLKAEISGHLPLKGVHINIHPDCESLQIYFDNEGNLQTPVGMVLLLEGKINPENSYTSVKTQFAPPDIHIAIIKLLKFLKNRYISDLKVFDEGEYWDTGDRDLLIEKIAVITKKMDMVEAALNSVVLQELKNLSPEEMAKRLEEILRKKLR